MMSSYSCANVINLPTRITTSTRTALDLCFTDFLPNDVQSGVMACDVSDHLPFFVFLPHSRKTFSNSTANTFYRKVNDETINCFRRMISEVDWSLVFNEEDPSRCYDVFEKKFQDAYYEAFPLVRRSRYKKSKKPWVTKELYKRIRQKHNLFADFLKHKDINILNLHKAVRNKLNTDLKTAKQEYYAKAFANKLAPNQIWRSYNNLVSKRTEPTPVEIVVDGVPLRGRPLSDMFNEHFLTVGDNQSAQTTCTDPMSYLKGIPKPSIFLSPTTTAEISSYIIRLKNNCSVGADNIKGEVVKAVSDIIAPLLSHICNQMLKEGRFPDKLKIARVCVVHKTGSYNDPNNYRPISVLPVFSKIAEQVINTRLTSYFIKTGAIAKEQYGFQKGKSTEKALLHIKDKIINNIENRIFTLGLFLDFRKAFDSVCHKILLRKLQFYGIRGSALNLIQSYLSSRVQFTMINDIPSSHGLIRTGVPQGSILGPILFLVHINDIVNILPSSETVLYADDTNIFFHDASLQAIECRANLWLENLTLWLRANRLELNITKTKYVIFRAKNKVIDNEPIILYNSNILQRVQSIKFLGVIFNEHLLWTDHINQVRKKNFAISGPSK